MNRYEIDAMMYNLPSQKARYKRERRLWIIEEALAGFAFIAFVITMIFIV